MRQYCETFLNQRKKKVVTYDIFINSVDDRINCTLGKFAVAIKLSGAGDTVEGRDTI